MDNHPIPQDVTGFKFKLIGSVTVKQFLYIMAGGILAVVTYMLPIPFAIRLPLCFLFGGTGAALAFLPIDGRPMDVMMKNFLKALPAENQYIFKKQGADVLITEFFSPPTFASVKVEEEKTTNQNSLESKRALLFGELKKNYRPDDREQAMLTNINQYLHETTQYSSSPSVKNLDSAPTAIVTPTQIVAPSAIPQVNITDAIRVVTPTFVPPPNDTPVNKPSPQIQLVEQLPMPVAPPSPVAAPQQPYVAREAPIPIPLENTPLQTVPVAPTSLQSVAPNESSAVTSVAPEATLKAGFPQLPDIPNVVLGIIKDPRGKIIPNILVEIMDLQGIPVRAFKTNALGQFAAATPLPNGEYNVLLEDPRKMNEFEQIHIILEGKIFEPLEIISLDQREKLRRELFDGGKTQATA